MKYSLMLTVLLFIAPFNKSCGQNEIGNHEFKVYSFYYRYDEPTQEYMRKHGFESTTLLNRNYIDPGQKTGKVDPKLVERFLNSRYPKKDATGVCVIDWEGKLFKVLQREKPNSRSFKIVEAEYIKLVKLVKKLRPNLKVGIYGLPFRVYRPSHLSFNEGNKFDKILSYCDFLAPSYYIMEPDLQVGEEANRRYFETNLKISLDYGKRLNKPVIPFVWYRVHRSNQDYGGAIIPQQQMAAYINYIASYTYNKKSASGIFWWEPSGKAEPTGTLFESTGTSGERNTQSRRVGVMKEEAPHDSIMINYTKPFINIQKRSN